MHTQLVVIDGLYAPPCQLGGARLLRLMRAQVGFLRLKGNQDGLAGMQPETGPT